MMGSRASLIKVMPPQQGDVASNGQKPNLRDTDHMRAQIAALESKVQYCIDLQQQNAEFQQRLVKLEQELDAVQQNQQEMASMSHLSVKKLTDNESIGSNLSDASPNDADASSSGKRRQRRMKRNREFSIAPMNDIEAYGKGLNLHEMNKDMISPNSIRRSRPSVTSTMLSPSDSLAQHSASFDDSCLNGKTSAALLKPKGRLTKSASIDVIGRSVDSDSGAKRGEKSRAISEHLEASGQVLKTVENLSNIDT